LITLGYSNQSQAAELSSVPRFPSADFRALSTLMTAPWRRPGLAWDQRSRPTGVTSALATRPLVPHESFAFS
jgi:hypothetical protein